MKDSRVLAGTLTRVAGHVAANFSIRNCLCSLMFQHFYQVGGQVADSRAGGWIPTHPKLPATWPPTFPSATAYVL